MKNFYFIAVLGLLLVGCSPENDELSQYSNQLITADATAECTISAGADKSVTITNDFVKANLYTPARLQRYYLKMLDAGVSQDGTFNPSMKSLISSYQNFNFQTFTTTYTVGEGDCTDSAELSITVVEKIEEPVSCFIGEDIYAEVSNKYIQENIGRDLGKLRNYYLSLLEEGVPTNGTFSPRMESIGLAYERNNFQTFTTTYTVDFGDCVDSVEISLKVLPPCAGKDKYVVKTNSFVQQNLYTPARLQRYYLSLLDAGVSKTGTFNPSMKTLIESYQSNNFQVFTTTYTLDEEGCSDSTTLSIEVTE